MNLPKAPPHPPRKRSPNDADRQERIAEAAIRVVADRGVEGLTHRAVAAEADVPLGSTTYYFATLEDMLAAATQRAADAARADLIEWSRSQPADVDIAIALAAWLVDLSGPARARTIAEYELYLASVRRPALQPISGAWSRLYADVLSERVGPRSARLLSLLADGLLLASLVGGQPLDQADVEAVLRHALAEP